MDIEIDVLGEKRLSNGALFVDIAPPRAPRLPAPVIELTGTSAGFASDFLAGFAVAFGDGCTSTEVMAIIETAACCSEVVDARAAVALPEPLEWFLRWGRD